MSVSTKYRRSSKFQILLITISSVFISSRGVWNMFLCRLCRALNLNVEYQKGVMMDFWRSNWRQTHFIFQFMLNGNRRRKFKEPPALMFCMLCVHHQHFPLWVFCRLIKQAGHRERTKLKQGGHVLQVIQKPYESSKENVVCMWVNVCASAPSDTCQ